MKIAFLFIVRDKINNVDLWRQYFEGFNDRFSCYIVSKSGRAETDIPNVINLHDKYDSDYGRTKYIQTVLFLLKEALIDKQNFKFILFSESCIPITSFSRLYDLLTKDKSAFINMGRVLDDWKAAVGRYAQLRKKDVSREEWYGHSAQAIVFNRKLAKFLVTTDSKIHNVINVYNIDEHYYAYAVISDGKKLNDFNITYSSLGFSNWKDRSESKNHRSYPKTYLVVDKELVQSIREMGYMFMRKIAPETVIDVAACISD